MTTLLMLLTGVLALLVFGYTYWAQKQKECDRCPTASGPQQPSVSPSPDHST